MEHSGNNPNGEELTC